MKKKTSTLIYFILLLSLLTISYSRAQLGGESGTATKKQKLNTRAGIAKIKTQVIADWKAKSIHRDLAKTSRPTKHFDKKDRKTRIPDSSATSRMQKSMLAMTKRKSEAVRKRNLATRPFPSTARKSATTEVPARLYVDYQAGGLGDGTTWNDAFQELSDALFYAKDNPGVTEIWVANGIYQPLYDQDYTADEVDDDPRDKVFMLLPDIKIYGGFAGTESSVAERNLRISANFIFDEQDDFATILSGDLFENDYPDGSTSENSYHVVLSAGNVGNASLDGFVIAGGNSDDEDAGGFVTVNGQEIFRAVGGGIVASGSSPFLSNLLISDNFAKQGSAICGTASNFILTNALIVNNIATRYGTVYLLDSSPVITNATITENEADVNCGGMLFEGATTAAIVRNTIIFGNAGGDNPNILFEADAAASFAFSIVQGSGGSDAWNADFGTDLGSNLDPTTFYDDPNYAGEIFFEAENYYFGLHPGSPAVNKGNNLYFQPGELPDLSALTTDQRGTARIIEGTVDIGALESLFGILTSTLTPSDQGILYVKKGGDGLKTGVDWNNAAAEVADALFAANLDPRINSIYVAGGTYFPLYRPDDLSNAEPKSRYNSFLVPKEIELFGGFAGTESSPEERNLTLTENASILSGDFDQNDEFDITSFKNDVPHPEFDENAYHVVYVVESHGDVLLDGFTIEGANNWIPLSEEGEPEEESETLFIRELEIPRELGAGIFVTESDPWFENIVLKNNVGTLGGGLTGIGSAWTLVNSAVYHNVDELFGSGIVQLASTFSVRMWNTTVAQNLSLSGSPAVGVIATEIEFANTIIYDNILAAGVSEEEDQPPIDFGAVFSFGYIANSLIKGSGGSNNWQFYNSDFFIEDFGGNLDENPEFNSIEDADFSLSVCSPAIDAGDGSWGGLALNDLAGNPRVVNDLLDMGAFEFQDVRSPGATALAGNDQQSSFVFEEYMSHTFSVEGEECESDLLTLISEGLSGEVTAKVWVDAEVNSYNGAAYLQRHFDVTPTDNPETSTGRVILYFTQAEFDALNEQLAEPDYLPTGDPDGEDERKANLRIYQFHGPSLDESGSPASYENSRTTIDPDDEDIIWNPAMNRWEVSFDVTGFSGFFGGTESQNPLPVRLISFEGKRIDNQQTKLDWKVVEQESISVYHVEYSVNGKTFRKIGQVSANTLASTDYSFTDTLAHSGENAFYRLKVIELDGKTAYSRIISVKLPAVDRMIAYPVPAKNELWIDWKKTEVTSVDLIDSNGRILKTVKKLSASQKVDISGLPTGILILKAAGNSVLRVVKE
jgi:hypothetical protein